MNYENVKLWFAKNENNNIVTIDTINESNKHNTYHCPVCGSDVKPKATRSKQITSHFAHVDASKCNSESQIHFWFKHRFLEKGDKFTVVSDKEREYICKEILVEQPYDVADKVYRPDVTIITECGNTIYFEMAFTNKKKVRDYLDIWLELRNIVVEVDIKQLMTKDEIPKFKALFYDGKCFNTKRNDTYYNTIGKYKEEKLSGKVDEKLKERIRKLDWFWDDVLRYKNGEVDIEYIVNLIDSIDERDYDFINEILTRIKCSNIMKRYAEIKTDSKYQEIKEKVLNLFGEDYLEYIRSRVEYSRILGEYEGSISYFNSSEKCWYMCSTSKFDNEEIVNDVIDCIKDNIKAKAHNEKVIKYNNDSNKIQYNINSNEKVQNIINEIKQYNTKYSLEIWVRTYDKRYISNANLDGCHKIIATLRYNSVTAVVFEITYDIRQENFNLILDTIIERINIYFTKLEVLTSNNVIKLNLLTNTLKQIFSDCKLEIVEKVWLEDVYEISVSVNYTLKSYAFTNKGLVDSLRNGKLIIPFNNLDKIKSFLIKDISNKLIEYHTIKCRDCDNKFKLSIGELKFYNKKGFDLPKRCKPCRNKRKKIN